MITREDIAGYRGAHLTNPIRRDRTAIDVPSAYFLCLLLDKLEAKCIVDIGCGFSTWVIRLWVGEQEESVSCLTTDQHSKWLNTTCAELLSLGLTPMENFYLHDEAPYTDWEGKADLVFLDTGPAHARIAAIPQSMRLLNGNGVLVIDDWHFPWVKDKATPVLEEAGFQVRPVPESIDQFDRFMAVACDRHSSHTLVDIGEAVGELKRSN